MRKTAIKKRDLEAGPLALQQAEAWNETNRDKYRMARAEVLSGKWVVLIYLLKVIDKL